MVPTEYFVTAMRKHWTKTLGNHTTSNLEQVWTIMGDTYGQVLSGKTDGRWQLINPETGTGKTEGSCLYLGHLGWYALRQNTKGDAPGAIFVARTIDQCEEAVAKINSHAGEVVALTRHSKNKVTLTECSFKPILVITHEAFVRSVEKIDGEFVGVWGSISSWVGGQRKLTIVDESLTNVVEHHIVTGNSVHGLLGDTPHYIKSKYTKEEDVLWHIATIIRDSKKPRLEGREVFLRWRESEFDLPEGLNWQGMSDELTVVFRSKKGSQDIHQSKLKAHLDTIRSVEGITNSWCYMTAKGGEHVLTSSRFKIPDDVPGPVILDATASQDVVSYLLGEDRVNLITMPRSRSYKNVTLHVARAKGVGIGKHEMRENRTSRSEALMRTIHNLNRDENKWLVVCHKDVEPIALKVRPEGVHVSVAHWGAIDGKNNWNDHDNVVIFGLSYRDEVWSDNSILSLRPQVDDEVIKGVRSGGMKKMLHNRVLSADIIQAVNRIRCRKVIDVEGNCPSANIRLILPSTEQGDYILQAIRDEMPELDVVDWNYDVENGEKAIGEITVNPDNLQDAVVAYLTNASTSEYSVATLCKRLNFDADTISKFRKHLKDPTSSLRTRLTALGMNIIVKGKGRGSQTFIFRPYELSRSAA